MSMTLIGLHTPFVLAAQPVVPQLLGPRLPVIRLPHLAPPLFMEHATDVEGNKSGLFVIVFYVSKFCRGSAHVTTPSAGHRLWTSAFLSAVFPRHSLRCKSSKHGPCPDFVFKEEVNIAEGIPPKRRLARCIRRLLTIPYSEDSAYVME